jgi:hypothetical protein
MLKFALNVLLLILWIAFWYMVGFAIGYWMARLFQILSMKAAAKRAQGFAQTAKENASRIGCINTTGKAA